MRISDWSSDVCSSDLAAHRLDPFCRDHRGAPDIGLAAQLVDHRAADASRRIGGKGEAALLIVAACLDQRDQPGLDQVVELARPRHARKAQTRDLAHQRTSAERRVGKKRVSTYRSRWLPYNT